jgi:hypothetical protein
MTDEVRRMWKETPYPSFRHNSENCMEGLRQATRNQGNRYVGRDLNTRPSAYEMGANHLTMTFGECRENA